MLDETAPGWATRPLPSSLRAPERLRGNAWFIPHHDMITAWRAHTETHDDPLYGLHFAERWTLALMGPLTDLVVFAPTLGDVVAAYGGVERLLDSAHLTSLSVQGDALVLVERPPPRHDPWPRHLAESILAGYVHVVRASVAERLVLREVAFMHERPADADAVERWFGAPVRWGAPDNRAVADADALALPMCSGSDVVFSRVREAIAGLREQLVPEEVLIERVRRVLRLGDDALRVASVESVARTLGMSTRSLQRHLGRAGLSFRRVVAEVRAELLQRAPPLRRLDLAQRLGFADDSALRKFLRR